MNKIIAEQLSHDYPGIKCTPLNGKSPFIKGWPDKPMTPEEAIKDYPEATGLGVMHNHPRTAVLDIDDYEKVCVEFTEQGLNLSAMLKIHRTIDSPKPNTAKIIFKVPEGFKLEYVNVKGIIELRAGHGVIDVLEGSEYHHKDGGFKGEYYTTNNVPLTNMPPEILKMWEVTQEAHKQKLSNYQSNSQHSPKTKDGKHSSVYWFNYHNSIFSVLDNFCTAPSYVRFNSSRDSAVL